MRHRILKHHAVSILQVLPSGVQTSQNILTTRPLSGRHGRIGDGLGIRLQIQLRARFFAKPVDPAGIDPYAVLESFFSSPGITEIFFCTP